MNGPSLKRLPIVLLAALGAACGGGDAHRPRHVLLITLDTTRADHLSCYGSARNETPALDALAREGVRFRDCTSAAATTLSSHTSLMTGSYPHRHGVVRNGFVVDEGNQLLAETLREAGFWCAAFVGSAALVERTGLSQGFQVYDDTFDVPVSPGGADQAQRLANSVTDAVLAHVDEVMARDGGDDARFFLFAHYFDPHAPYAPPSDLVAAHGTKLAVGDFDDIEAAVRAQQESVLGEELGQQAVIARGLPRQLTESIPSFPSRRDLELAQLYAAEVTFMDREIGRLLVGLEARGLLADTLIVVTADHGETFWEHGNFWNHGLWVSQTDVHVPLILRLPDGQAAGLEVEVPVSGVDVAPTILDALGLLDDGEADSGRGRSLLPLFEGDDFEVRAVFTEATQPGPYLEHEPGLAWGGALKPRAVRLGPWKLVSAPYLGLTQLFNLDDDPDENVDLLARGTLSPDAQAALAELELALGRWLRAAQPRPSKFDETQARALAGLGYGGDAQTAGDGGADAQDERKDDDE